MSRSLAHKVWEESLLLPVSHCEVVNVVHDQSAPPVIKQGPHGSSGSDRLGYRHDVF